MMRLYANGRVEIDPTTTNYAYDPAGKVFGYNLQSDGRFFLDPVRQSVFPPPSPTFFENTPNVIGDNDLTLAGTSAVINLGKLFITNPMHALEAESWLTTAIYVPSIGGGELPLVFAYTIPEPATAAIAAICLFGLIAGRRWTGDCTFKCRP
jgi:hypothetical protein